MGDRLETADNVGNFSYLETVDNGKHLSKASFRSFKKLNLNNYHRELTGTERERERKRERGKSQQC